MTTPRTDKTQYLAQIEAIESGTADGDTLAAAWREVKNAPLNLRTRMRKAIASSPSLPPSIALGVIGERPAEMFANPALPLLLLEAPDILACAPRAFWNLCLAAPSLPATLMPALVAACPHARMGELARRPEFESADAPALLERLLSTIVPGAPRWELTEHHALLLCQQWSDPMFDLPSELVDALWTRRDDVRAVTLLARCAQVAPDVALSLPRDQHPAVTESLAARRDLSPADLDHLAAVYGGAREAVAANPSADANTLGRLVRDHNPAVSAAAMLNPSLPRAAYELLLKRGTARRRALLAARPDLTDDDYDLLSRAGELDVRLSVAQNPRAPARALARLADDLLDAVREALATNPSYVPVVTSEASPEATVEAPPAKPARKKKVPPTLLERARPVLLGNMSAKPRWEEVLAWVESGGERPKRATLSPQDRKRLMRGALKILGEDPSAYDAQHTRLLAGIIDALGYLPELAGPWHRRVRDGTEAERAAVAAQWMSRLAAAGYTEAESLALLLDRRGAAQYGVENGWSQGAVASSALAPRLDRVVEFASSLKPAKTAAHFVEDVGQFVSRMNLPREDAVRRLAALVTGARDVLTGPQVSWFAQFGGEALFDALDPSLADELLRALDLRRAWAVPKPLADRARRLQEEQG